ncbi:MAG: outer membrane protein assembly factor BamE [Burkholderiaceae bacterium]
MSASYRRSAQLGLLAVSCAWLAACAGFDNASHRVAGLVTPYKVEVVQGNFVSREQVQALQAGMSRAQVRDLLGTPLLTSVFHADRWDYVFTLRRQGVEPQARKLAVFFKDDVLERFEGDEMPSEAEFVGQIDPGRKRGQAPVLEAPEESLKKFPPPAGSAPQDASGATNAPLPTSYPPLEAPSR